MASESYKNCALITGGLGFIGSFIARHLIENRVVDRVVCADLFSVYINPLRQGFVDYRPYRFEGLDESLVIERCEAKYYSVLHFILEKYLPKFVFHLAALPLARLDNLNTQEAREGTLDATSNILEAISRLSDACGYKPERFVYASSSMVYGNFSGDSVTEESPTKPTNIYGAMKLAGEVLTKGLGQSYGIPVTIVRPSAVYGPTDMNQRVSQIFLERALTGKALRIDGPNEKLDFTYVKDAACGFALAAQSEKAIGETFNITYGRAHTLMEYVVELQRSIPDLKYDVADRNQNVPQRGTLCIDKASSLLGYKPKYSLAEGIREYMDFAEQFKERLA